MRKYYFNEKFFDEINTIEKAYWLGFICADGSILNHSKVTKSLQMRINIHEKDDYLLEEFKKDIEGNVPIRYFIALVSLLLCELLILICQSEAKLQKVIKVCRRFRD